MTTTLNREWRKEIKRDIQRRVEDYVIKYCEALEENFKQHSINSYKRNIESPTSATVGHKSYYEEQLQKIEDGTANLYKFDYQVGKKYIKVFNLQYSEACDYYNRPAGYRAGSVTAFINLNSMPFLISSLKQVILSKFASTFSTIKDFLIIKKFQ